MDDISQEHLDRWKEVSRGYLLSGREAPAPNAEIPGGRELPSQCKLESRRGRDRFLSHVRQRLFCLMRETGRYGENALRELERAFHSHVSFIARHPDVPRRILTWSLQSADARLRRRVQKVMAHYEFRLVRLIANGQQQGCIRADIEPHAASGLFIGMLQNLVLRLSADGLQPERLLQEANHLFSAYLKLVRAGGQAGGISCEPRLNPSAA